jgi:hypothetical protein
MSILNGYVSTCARPEASMIEGYCTEEAIESGGPFCNCDTRFAKKRSWRLFFLFFSHSVYAFWEFGIWGKSFTSRAVGFVWLGACDGVGSYRVGELGRDSCFGPLTFPNPSRPFSPNPPPPLV